MPRWKTDTTAIVMRRTEPVRIGELLLNFRETPHIARKIAEGKLPAAWRQVAGELVWSYTTELQVKGVILTVKISSSTIRHEMFMQRASLLASLNEAIGVPFLRDLIIK